MKSYTVKQGECLITIAAENGFGGNWQALYEHEVNADLRKKRPDPFCLMPGDIVNIPESKNTITLSTNRSHRLILKRPEAYFSIQLRDQNENPLKDVKYILVLEGKSGSEFTAEGTAKDGKIEYRVPIDMESGILQYWPDQGNENKYRLMELGVGHLSPSTEHLGKQTYLANKGYYDGDFNGQMDDTLKQALSSFKKEKEIEEASDEELEKKLAE